MTIIRILSKPWVFFVASPIQYTFNIPNFKTLKLVESIESLLFLHTLLITLNVVFTTGSIIWFEFLSMWYKVLS